LLVDHGFRCGNNHGSDWRRLPVTACQFEKAALEAGRPFLISLHRTGSGILPIGPVQKTANSGVLPFDSGNRGPYIPRLAARWPDGLAGGSRLWKNGSSP
jgi:hypothetical protein